MTVAYVMENIILKSLLAVFDWMKLIFVSFDAWGWIFGSFGMFVTYRFLLKPLLGGKAIGDSKSDSYSKSSKESSGEDG